jgi:hypothetical protein
VTGGFLVIPAAGASRHLCDASCGTGARAPFSAPAIAKPIVTTAATSMQSAVKRPMRVVWRSLMGSLAMIHCTLRAGAAHRNSWRGPLRRSP